MIIYNKLWKTLEKRGISQYKLINTYQISPGQLTRLHRNESVTTHTLDRLCNILQCDLSDIVEYIPSKAESDEESL
ncbi:MAG: helix-turn-helix transcriptional regulator [Solobacterium sp.]|nr:helix-turn-helix transcriptional regulator [Solobacterium sp.]